MVASEGGIGLSFSNSTITGIWGEKVAELPPGTDHHELLASFAPRPFMMIGGDSADKDESWHYIKRCAACLRTVRPTTTDRILQSPQRPFPDTRVCIACYALAEAFSRGMRSSKEETVSFRFPPAGIQLAGRFPQLSYG